MTGEHILAMREQGRIHIDPFDPSRLGPNSYNLSLGRTVKVYEDLVLDFSKKPKTKELVIPEDGFALHPGIGYLASTNEECGSDEFVCYIDGRSSFGRLFVLAHCTAGRGDLGFGDGRRRETWTLEIVVVGDRPVIVRPGDVIAQATFHATLGDRSRLYRGRYAGQQGPTEGRGWDRGAD